MKERVLNGIFVINKHQGVTSRTIDNLIMKKFKTRKVGHLGTLDPLATGLLIVALNEATKTLSFYEDETKTYEATFELGRLTSTLDLEGEVTFSEQVKPFPDEKVFAAVNSFQGKINQTPPLASALKVDGKRLYEYARENKQVKIKEREVEILAITLLDYSFPKFTIRAKVSKGTYIRTLGLDIAKKLGTVATTTNLVRTEVGKFSLSDAVTVSEVTTSDLKSVDSLLENYPKITIEEQQLPLIMNGRALKHDYSGDFVTIYYGSKLLAIYEWRSSMYFAKRGFNL